VRSQAKGGGSPTYAVTLTSSPPKKPAKLVARGGKLSAEIANIWRELDASGARPVAKGVVALPRNPRKVNDHSKDLVYTFRAFLAPFKKRELRSPGPRVSFFQAAI
jgi:hypothetical protein